MPNPKRKHTRSRRDSRRASNWKLEIGSLSACSNPGCGKTHAPHRVCPHCGFYDGKLIVPKREKKGRANKDGTTETKEQPEQ